MPLNSLDDYPMTWRPVLPAGPSTLYLALAELLEWDAAKAARLSIDAPATEEELQQGIRILKNLWHSSPISLQNR